MGGVSISKYVLKFRGWVSNIILTAASPVGGLAVRFY
jgi:hypothetical protein